MTYRPRQVCLSLVQASPTQGARNIVSGALRRLELRGRAFRG
jgi:hypothetical protein